MPRRFQRAACLPSVPAGALLVGLPLTLALSSILGCLGHATLLQVAVLQLASRRHAFLIDMPLLAQEHPKELSSALALVWHNPSVLKLGETASESDCSRC